MNRLTIAALLALPAPLLAQDQADAPVRANVVSVTDVQLWGETNFGDVPNHSHNEVLNPAAPVPGQQTTAQFRVATAPGAEIRLAYAACPISLFHPDGSTKQMRFYAQVSLSADGFDQLGSWVQGECDLLASYSTDSGVLYGWLGGRLEVGPNQAVGLYQGTQTIIVTFF